jgi:hypothetical protein
VADKAGISPSLIASAAWQAVGLVATLRYRLPKGEGADLEPSRHWPEMAAVPAIEFDRGPVLVTVEYRINGAHLTEFLDAIRPLREARLRDGALRWHIFQDVSETCRIVEVFLVESWVEHLRQHERVTEADRIIQGRLRSLQEADSPPKVTHLVSGLDRANKAGQAVEGQPTMWESLH